MKALFAWAKTRLEDLARERRINRYASLAVLADQHGHPRAALMHAKDMRREMNQRSAGQKARLVKQAARNAKRLQRA